MQIKTQFVLPLACLLFSTSLHAYEYENSSFSDDSYSSPEFIDDNRSSTPAVVETVEYEFYDSPREISGRANYAARLPHNISAPGERLIVVNPRSHVWGAYTEKGKLIRAGLATAGAKWCEDIGRPCRTKSGVFRIYSLGGSDCVSSIYPVGEGGAPMPYCMFFNGGQGLHGSNHLAEANLSHGCVRISVDDAEWLRYNFARVGTKVIVQAY